MSVTVDKHVKGSPPYLSSNNFNGYNSKNIRFFTMKIIYAIEAEVSVRGVRVYVWTEFTLHHHHHHQVEHARFTLNLTSLEEPP